MIIHGSTRIRQKLVGGLVGLALLVTALSCQSPPAATAPDSSAPGTAPAAPATVLTSVLDAGLLNAPADMQAQRLDVEVERPSGLAVGQDGALYVAGLDASGSGQVVRLLDGQTDQVAAGLAAPRGLARWMPADAVSRLLVATRDGLVVIENGVARLAGRLGDGAGRANDVAIGTDGLVYVTGAAAGAPRPGAVWRFDPAALLAAGSPTQGELFVTGMRSADGITWSPSGAIYVTDNGLGWPFQPDVPDELNVLLGGGDYGWPQVWGQPPVDSGTIGPMAIFPAGADAGSLLFYSGRMFPEYAADLLVALPGLGKVVRVEIVSDAQGYRSAVYDFIDGLEQPTALAEGPQGELYIGDTAAGAVYRLWR